MVLAMPQGIGLPFALTPMEITIGVKGKKAWRVRLCMVDIDPDAEYGTISSLKNGYSFK